MGSGKLPDFDAERPPDLGGLAILGKIAADAPPGLRQASVALAFGERSRSRLRITAHWLAAPRESACQAGIILPRGHVLRSGVWVHNEQLAVRILAADEDLLEVRAASDAPDPHLALLRAAYHLGNRHVALQIEPGLLKLEYDYVLSDMLVGMGLKLRRVVAPFEPEWGAYAASHGH